MSGKHCGWSEVDREYLSSGSPLRVIFCPSLEIFFIVMTGVGKVFLL